MCYKTVEQIDIHVDIIWKERGHGKNWNFPNEPNELNWL